MLSVYIADDEDALRQGLKKIIDWNKIGFEICGEANNGLTAYNEIRQMLPDLILLDIRMPKLQGLDLASQLREEGYTGRIIILSGYSEFKYAQDAIKYGVDFYLTKPIDEVDLLKAVEETREILQKERLHTEHVSYYQEKAKIQIIEEIIKDERNSLATLNYSLGELNLEADLYMILIIESFNNELNVYEELCKELKIPSNSQYIERLKIEYYEVILLKGEFIIGRFYTFKERNANHNNRDYFISAGSGVSGINEIYYSYHKALATYERKFFFESNKFVAGPEDLPDVNALSEKFTGQFSRTLGKRFYDLIKLHKVKTFNEEIEKIYKRMLNSVNSAESVRSILAGMYINVVQEFRRDYSSHGLKFLTNAEVIQNFQKYDYLTDILNFISTEFNRMIHAISQFSSDSIVDDIIEYINIYYAENIKLKVLAPKFGYNSSYLGKIFNKKIGVGFNDYLHQIRIEKSKELLLEDTYKIYEISQMIGYKNVDYFHLKFKHFIGITPNEYRVVNQIKVSE